MTREKTINVQNGWFMLLVTILVFLLGLVWKSLSLFHLSFIANRRQSHRTNNRLAKFLLSFFRRSGDCLGPVYELWLFHASTQRSPCPDIIRGLPGTNGPADFSGPIRYTPSGGFRCGRASQRAETQVNDKRGNPVEIAAVMCGAWETRPNLVLMWSASRITLTIQSESPCAPCQFLMPMITAGK